MLHDIPKEVRRLRADAGWTQADLAELVGVTRSAVAQWEAGANEPPLSRLRKLLKLRDAVPHA